MALHVGVIFFLIFATAVAEDVTVVTEIGNITGSVEEITFNGMPLNITKFLGIPYAEPPTGTGRFNKPIKKKSLSGHFIAKTKPPICIQSSQHLQEIGVDPASLNQDEDCLYLNIYIPGNGPVDKMRKYAVMIWFYGGGFQMGYQDAFETKAFPGLNDVILVTFNYRVSFLGFLSTSEDNLSGNYGLWDQHEAMKWVHDNIENFGGDPTKITVFGESAGAVSVVYQAFYPGNEGLFQRVIAQSGSANVPWAHDANPSAIYTKIAKKTGCLRQNQMETIDCLRGLNVTEITGNVKYDDEFYPVKDGDFIKIHTTDIFQNSSNRAWEILKRFGKLDFIFGVTSSEAGMFLNKLDEFTNTVENAKPSGYNRDTFENKIVPYGLKEAKLIDSETTRAALIHQYADWTDPDNESTILKLSVDLFSDSLFNAGAVQSAMAHSDSGGEGTLYFFVFDYKGQLSDPRVSGASHADEVPFVLGFPAFFASVYDWLGLSITQDEFEMSKKLMKYWTNFAKTGDPNNGDTVSGLTTWPEYNADTQNYIRFHSPSAEFPIESHYVASRMNFWHKFIPKVSQDSHCRVCPTCETSGFTGLSYSVALFISVTISLYR